MDFPNYMKMPPGFERSSEAGTQLVCKLLKSLYGTKQAGRMWFINLVKYLESLGFKRIESDRCVMVLSAKDSPNGIPAMITIYVDDCMVMSSSLELIEDLKAKFHQHYSIKDLGEAKWLLKIQIERMREGQTEVLWLGQPQYVEKLLITFQSWMPISERQITTPMVVGWKHDVESAELVGQEKSIYRSVVASMSYLAQQTRLDIVFAVNHLAQFSHCPRECDKLAVSRILGYLKAVPDLGPTYFRSASMQGAMKTFLTDEDTVLNAENAPQGSADARWGTEQNFKSRSGILFCFAKGPVTWYSGKQLPTATSATEAELYSLADAVKEAMFIRNVFKELGVEHERGTIMLEDNTAAIEIAGDPKHHARVKHLGIRLSFLRDAIEQKMVNVKWCPTADMLADVLTKALPHAQFWSMMDRIGMRQLSKLSKTDVTP
jgi:hypothetical protein